MVAVKGQKPHRGKQVTAAEFRRLWTNPAMNVDDIAAALDICRRSVWQRARHRGLLPRRDHVKIGPAPMLTAEDEAMYRAGVDAVEIAERRGIKVSSVHMHMWRNDVKRIVRVTRWAKPLTIAEYRLREAMALDAAKCRVQFAAAEMLDNYRPARSAAKAAS